MSYLETNYLYLALLIFSIAYPLAQSFEHRIQFYKKWKYIFFASVVMMLLFIPWDIWFTIKGVWKFNKDYTLGITIFQLPIEEWLFFICIPFSCVFIYEVVKYYIHVKIPTSISRLFFLIVGVFLILVSLFHFDKTYTAFNFFISGIGTLFIVVFNPKWQSNFLISYFVTLLPFMLINGILTGSFIHSPVVSYNSNEILGIRIFTIPIEDSVYNLLLFMIVIAVYEKIRTNTKPIS